MWPEPEQEEVRRAKDALSEAKLSQIKKENTFRSERNAKIRELLDWGLKINVVAALSGYSKNAILRIKWRRGKY